MNDLQLHIYQLLQEMDSSENEQSENEKGEHVENVEKSKEKSKKKEKWLTLSSQRTLSLGGGSSGAPQEIEENEEVMHLLQVLSKKSIKDNKE